MRRTTSSALALLPLLLLVASPAMARDSLGIFESWGVFRDPATPRCYAIAQPVARRGQQPRGFASVGTWPRQKVRGQLHVRFSRARADKAPVILTVGERRFTLVGAAIAKKAVELGVTEAVFDRSSYRYHGRVKAVAEGARSGGLTV